MTASKKTASVEEKKRTSANTPEKVAAEKPAKQHEWDVETRDMNVAGIRDDFLYKIKYYQIKDEKNYTSTDAFVGLSLTMRDRLVERWIETQKKIYCRKRTQSSLFIFRIFDGTVAWEQRFKFGNHRKHAKNA